MNSSNTLKYAQKANELAKEISQLVNEVTRTSNQSDHLQQDSIFSLSKKLTVMRIYLNDMVNELQWRYEVKTALKREIDKVLWIGIGAALGGFLMHLI